VHSLSTTAANVHDSTQMSKLLHGQERAVFGDQAYWNEPHRQSALAAGIRYRINRRSPRRPLTEYQRFINRRRSAARARVEHVFHVVKRLWGFSEVRYCGLAKNTARPYTAFALANLYLLRRRLLSPQGRVPGERDEHRKARETQHNKAFADFAVQFSMIFIVISMSHPARTSACAELP
jgi:IS5 family transposase